AHAAATGAQGLRGRDRHDAFSAGSLRRGLRARGARLEETREGRSPVRAPGGGRYAARRREPCETGTGLVAERELRAAGENDGGCRPGAPHVKVLVTGANGFVGRAVVKRLLADGDTVIAAVGPGAPGRAGDPRLTTVSLDLTNEVSIPAALTEPVD